MITASPVAIYLTHQERRLLISAVKAELRLINPSDGAFLIDGLTELCFEAKPADDVDAQRDCLHAMTRLRRYAHQRCLDIVNGNFDARKPADDLTEIIARIVTDIQALP